MTVGFRQVYLLVLPHTLSMQQLRQVTIAATGNS
jgi:hypothetical protein